MKILFCYEFPFHREWYGGGHQIIRGLARALARLGHEVHISCNGHDKMGVVSADAPVRYHFTQAYQARWGAFLVTGLSLLQAVHLRPDWICCFTSEAALINPVANLLGMRTAVYLAAPDLPDLTGRKLSTLRGSGQTWLYMMMSGAKASQRVSTLSEYTTRQASENWHIPSAKLTTVGLGLADDYMAPSSAQRRLGSSGPRFISVGRLELSQKPLDAMAAALGGWEQPWQDWTIVGSTPSNADKVKLMASLDSSGITPRTNFVGTKSASEIRPLLDAHDIALLPSYRESFFLTVYEAAASGKVIVTNDVAGVSQFFADCPTVIIAENATPEAYRDALSYAVKDYPRLLKHTGDVSRRVRQQYTWKAAAERLLNSLGE